jgi:hypothetical protein
MKKSKGKSVTIYMIDYNVYKSYKKLCESNAISVSNRVYEFIESEVIKSKHREDFEAYTRI